MCHFYTLVRMYGYKIGLERIQHYELVLFCFQRHWTMFLFVNSLRLLKFYSAAHIYLFIFLEPHGISALLVNKNNIMLPYSVNTDSIQLFLLAFFRTPNGSFLHLYISVFHNWN